MIPIIQQGLQQQQVYNNNNKFYKFYPVLNKSSRTYLQEMINVAYFVWSKMVILAGTTQFNT